MSPNLEIGVNSNLALQQPTKPEDEKDREVLGVSAEIQENENPELDHSYNEFKNLVTFVENDSNRSATLDLLVNSPAQKDMDRLFQELSTEKGIKLDLSKARLAATHLENIFVTAEAESQESQQAFLRIKKVFASIAAKDYFELAEIEAFFSEVEYRTTLENDNNVAKIENNKLIIFDNILKKNENKYIYDDERLEYIVLHEIGHIIDESHVLEIETMVGENSEEQNQELEDLVNAIPIEFQDPYSISCYRQSPETFSKEVKAHLIAIWSKHRGNFESFFLERLGRTNPEMQKQIFGQNIDRALLRESFDQGAEDLVNLATDDTNAYNQIYQNSLEIFNYLENNWASVKNNMPEEYLESLKSLSDLEINELIDFGEDDIVQNQEPNQQPEQQIESDANGQELSKKNKIGTTEEKKTPKNNDFGTFFAKAGDLLSSFGELDIFFGGK